VVHNIWRGWEKATHLLAILQGQAVDVLRSVPTEASSKGIIEALGWNADHQLAVAYHAQLTGESLQEFPATTEQFTHHAFVGLPQYFIWWEAALHLLIE
jgi:hypothetical protein